MSGALTEEGQLASDKFSKDISDKKADSAQALTEGEALYNIPQTKIIQPGAPSQKYGAMANMVGNLSSLFKPKPGYSGMGSLSGSSGHPGLRR